MKDVKDMHYLPDSESLVEILMSKTQNTNPNFFRVQIAYYFSKIASAMRTNIATHDRGLIPVSCYALNLAPSGSGKGLSTNIIEDTVINKFKETFTEVTLPLIAEENLAKIATARANKTGNDPDETLESLIKDYNSLGKPLFSFDSGTTPAVKQLRQKFLLAGCGSINLEIDEIGSNLIGNSEVLTTFLELFDVGKIKQKLIKNTSDQIRIQEMDGRTPTNMMLFGTPAKLLNGSKIEDELHSMFETGYARRLLVGYIDTNIKKLDMTPEQIYDLMTDKSKDKFIKDLSIRLGNLADRINFNIHLTMTKNISLILIKYKLNCEQQADTLPDHEEVRKAEISHRYFKALKLSGAYAFISGQHEITEDCLYAAIKLVEESGEAFKRILNREKVYVKLAKYIASVGDPLTQVDLVEALPFYKGTESQKRDMMSLAVAYGYRNNIIIKKSFIDGIEFLEGESMQITDLTKMTVAYSNDITTNYRNDTAPFDELYKLVTSNMHYTAHHFNNNYRNEANAIQGFNLVILDVDDGITLNSAKLLLKGYKALFATTKRHTPDNNRFRIILPLTHIVKLSSKLYREFMKNVYAWLPFEVDAQTFDIARKWEGFAGSYEYIDGELLDSMLFIPQTKKAEEVTKQILNNQSLSNIERWFINNTGGGNRSNQLIKYALILVDQGYSYDAVKHTVEALNQKLPNPLGTDEIANTILLTAMKKIAQRDNQN